MHTPKLEQSESEGVSSLIHLLTILRNVYRSYNIGKASVPLTIHFEAIGFYYYFL